MIRKSNYLISVLLFFCMGATAQRTKISGNISGLNASTIKISYLKGDSSHTDTVQVTSGKFTWQAPMPEPQKVYIMFPNRYFPFFAEAGDISITGNADSIANLKVTGSSIQDEADAFEKSIQDITDQESPLYQKWGKVSEEEQAALEKKIDDLRMQRRESARQYIAAHPNSAFSVSKVADRAVMGEYSEVHKLYDLLSSHAKQTTAGKKIAERMILLKRSAIGQPMLNFTQNNTEGKPVHFSDFKGKYVFVDFWASWCGPCRAENPNVLKAYNKYKEENFTVIGVSLDEDGEKWKKAIKEDGMPWTQVSDLKGWQNEVSTYYGIRGIPSTLLVNPEGKIIAKNLRGQALQDKLAEIFN